MAWQLVRRLLIFLVSAVVASMLVFLVLVRAGQSGAHRSWAPAPPTRRSPQLSEEMGLDRPLVVQYWDWATGLLHGDFGVSYISHAAIGPQISDRLQVTLWLVLGAMIVALLVAVPLGVVSALRHGRPSGYLLSGLSQVGVAVPAFLAAIILVAIFAVGLGWLPANGYTVPAQDPGKFLRADDPAVARPWVWCRVRCSPGTSGPRCWTRWARTTCAPPGRRGSPRARRLVRHGLRNAAIPVLTVIGVQLVTILVGAVVVERVFVIPGIGSFLADSVARRDLLAVQGIVVTWSSIALLISFLVDVAYTVIDPRLRRR